MTRVAFLAVALLVAMACGRTTADEADDALMRQEFNRLRMDHAANYEAIEAVAFRVQKDFEEMLLHSAGAGGGGGGGGQKSKATTHELDEVLVATLSGEVLYTTRVSCTCDDSIWASHHVAGEPSYEDLCNGSNEREAFTASFKHQSGLKLSAECFDLIEQIEDHLDTAADELCSKFRASAP
jgi:hypothetical protein